MKHHKVDLLKRSAKFVERFQQRFDGQTSGYKRRGHRGGGVYTSKSRVVELGV